MKDYSEALSWLYSTQVFGMKPGLDPVLRMTKALRIPVGRGEDSGNSILRFHAAGTNGKGSTCAMIAAVCRAAGKSTGLYTSPHLVSFRERIQVNGALIPEDAVLEGLSVLRGLVADWNPHPTFFELTTVLALRWFAMSGVSAMVLETGMGGRLDATNVVTPTVSILTPVGLDHQKHLGNTLSEIAGEKAGIIKRGVPVVSAPQAPEVRRVFDHAAERMETGVRWVAGPWQGAELGLKGEMQRWNAALAEQAIRSAWPQIGNKAFSQGFAEVHWPGRFEKAAADLILDGAHNPHAALQLAKTWREMYGLTRAHIFFGAADDKNVVEMLRILSPLMESLCLVPIRGNRAMSGERMRELAAAAAVGVPVRIEESLEKLLSSRPGGLCLLTGSLFLVGEALGILRGVSSEVSLQ